MPTRWYFQSSGTPGPAPAFDAAWTTTNTTQRLPMATAKAATPASNAPGGGDGSGVGNVLLVQFISPALAAQAISGAVKGQLRCRETDAAINARAQAVIRIVAGNGTVRGTLLAAHSAALSSEWALGMQNRKFPLAALSPATLTEVTAQDGDHLVIEVGARVDDNGIDQVILLVQDDQASDLAEDETSGGAANPWIEFSADIALQGVEAGSDNAGGSLGLGMGMGI